jgi:hypothetical protein
MSEFESPRNTFALTNPSYAPPPVTPAERLAQPVEVQPFDMEGDFGGGFWRRRYNDLFAIDTPPPSPSQDA